MPDTRKPPTGTRGFITRGPERWGSPTRLAHWPPPSRFDEEKPKVVRYVADEERERVKSKPSGFKLTRGLLTKKDE